MSPDARVVTLGKARRTLDAASRAVARCPEWAAQVRKNWSQHPNVRGAPMTDTPLSTVTIRLRWKKHLLFAGAFRVGSVYERHMGEGWWASTGGLADATLHSTEPEARAALLAAAVKALGDE